MSDFLDRLAARAIGGEAALAPRLPSLFEPLARAPSMATADEGEAPARTRDASRLPPPAAAPPPRPPVPARELIEPRAPRPSPAEPAPLPLPARAAADAPGASMPPSRAAAPARAMAAEPSPARSAPDSAVATPTSVAPRAARLTPVRHESMQPPAAIGALLPAPTPVFATTHAATAPAQPGRTAAMRLRRDAQAAQGNRAGGEPVVHVSIGRLEVRAAPAAVAPPRRRDGPQPGSLDDYLRQRGKASP